MECNNKKVCAISHSSLKIYMHKWIDSMDDLKILRNVYTVMVHIRR